MIRSLICALFFLPALASADTFNFTNLTASDFEDISKELSSDFTHHSVQGAAPLGSILGFEVGLIGGQESSPHIDEIVTRNGGSGMSKIYHGGLLGVISVPFGITGELVYLPKMTASGAEGQMTSAALKLSLNTELLKVIPFNLALRGVMSNSKLNFTQTNSGADIKVENENKVTGIQLLASPSLPVIEPYAGIGLLTGTNTLTATGGSIFAPGFTTSQSAENTVRSTQVLLGVTANLLFFHVGAEYSNAFGASTYTGKLAFGF
jgi:hypothetical protein